MITSCKPFSAPSKKRNTYHSLFFYPYKIWKHTENSKFGNTKLKHFLTLRCARLIGLHLYYGSTERSWGKKFQSNTTAIVYNVLIHFNHNLFNKLSTSEFPRNYFRTPEVPENPAFKLEPCGIFFLHRGQPSMLPWYSQLHFRQMGNITVFKKGTPRNSDLSKLL